MSLLTSEFDDFSLFNDDVPLLSSEDVVIESIDAMEDVPKKSRRSGVRKKSKSSSSSSDEVIKSDSSQSTENNGGEDRSKGKRGRKRGSLKPPASVYKSLYYIPGHRAFRGKRKGYGRPSGLRAVTVSVKKVLNSRRSSVSVEQIAADVCQDLCAADEMEARNIKRRTYDVVNVLKAVGILSRLSNKSLVHKESLILSDIDVMCHEKNDRLLRIEKKQLLLDQLRQDKLKLEAEKRQAKVMVKFRKRSPVVILPKIVMSNVSYDEVITSDIIPESQAPSSEG